MKSHPTLRILIFLCFVLFSFIINYSCSKDEELLRDRVLSKPTKAIDEVSIDAVENDTATAPATIVDEPEELIEDDLAAKIFETRTTIFPPINDGHLQGDNGFDQNIVRLEEERRVSYLMFDLSQIDTLGGSVSETDLEFTIESDGGSGTISVFKGLSNDWIEEELSTVTAPEPDSLLGRLTSNYGLGTTHEVSLDTTLVRPEVITLIMTHEDGNDLAFASKEHPTQKGPALKVVYSVPQNAEAIVFDEVVELEAETPEEDFENENVTEESTTKEENQAEETTEEVDDSASEGSQDEEAEEEIDEASNDGGETDSDPLPEGEESAEETDSNAPSAEEDETVAEESEEANQDSTSEEADDENEAEEEEEEIIVAESNSEADAPQNEAPRAVAEADNTTGNTPLTVIFKSSGSSDDLGIEQYVWDFRDGSTSSEPNPSHTFEKTGTLEVRLTVTDAQGESNTDIVTITVKADENEAPVAVAEASNLSGEAPLEIQFAADGSTDDGEIESYRWNFKDGNTTGSKNPSHTFNKAGTYEVELTVTDDKGLTNSKTLTITVDESENQAPVAEATATPLSGFAPLEVSFKSDKSTDDKKIDGYFWDFKDGNTTTSKNPSHTFADPGNYEVELSVKDEDGQTNATTITIRVDQRPIDNGGDSGSDVGGNNGEDSGNENNGGGNSGNGGSSTPPNTGNYPSNAVFASSFGYNSSDATNALEAAIRSGSSYVVVDKQSSDWIIKPLSFFDLKNITIVFEPGVTLRAKSGAFSKTNDQLFQLLRANNVTIEGYGATFKMNKNEYSGGEHRHTLAINKSKNVTVRGLTLRDSGGDGILIAGIEEGTYSENIIIEDVVATNNKRLGLGIISAQDVWIRNSEFSRTSGTKPEAGVDLEPNHASERLVNINFINCKFSNNDSMGFFLSTGKMNSSSIPVSVKVSNSEFSFNSKSPQGNTPKSEIQLSQGVTTNPVRGEILFEGVRFNGSNNKVLFSRKSEKSYKAVFKNCSANDVAKNSDSVIGLESLSTLSSLGGFVFDNFKIQYNSNASFMQIRAPSSGYTVRDINGDFSITEPNDRPLKYVGGYNENKNVNVSINYSHN